jgi:thiamine biosynthesis lipoprotein ApbE
MKLFARLAVCSLLFVAMAVQASESPKIKKASRLYVSHFENVLGTSLEIKIKSVSEKQAAVAEAAAMKEIDRVSRIVSAYDANSEFSKWMRTTNEAKYISPELFEVLSLFDQWRTRSNGALDASAQVVSKLWKEAAARQTIPTQSQLNAAVAEVKQAHWKLDAATQTATHLSNAPLMLNSFAKSYIIKRAADVAMAVASVNAVVVNIGGDIVIAGNLAEPVQISDPKADAENDEPLDKLLISNKAVATSGNYRRGQLINGTWYSHIIDPRTALPAGQVISATVVSPNATDAGALATAMNVLTPGESAKLAATVPGTEYMLITKEGTRIESDGWKKMEIPAAKKVTPTSMNVSADQWNPDYELLVNFEIAQLEGFPRRPYVAVWIEDADKKAVRTVALWFQKDRWIRDLRAWYIANSGNFGGQLTNAGLSSISSATRSAGKYSVKWDGKDDKGEYVKPGKYTVHIEAAREHGTYQMISQEMNFTGVPKQVTLTGNIEIASASLDYRKKN